MTPNSATKDDLFTDALALPPAERGAFLAKACGADVELLAELAALIAAHEGPESLVSPALAETVAATPDNRAGDWIGRYRLLQQIGEGFRPDHRLSGDAPGHPGRQAGLSRLQFGRRNGCSNSCGGEPPQGLCAGERGNQSADGGAAD